MLCRVIAEKFSFRDFYQARHDIQMFLMVILPVFVYHLDDILIVKMMFVCFTLFGLCNIILVLMK